MADMKSYKRIFLTAIIFVILQPIFLQCLEEEIDNNLVNHYKQNQSERENFKSKWFKQLFDKTVKNHYKAAHEAQRQLDQDEVAKFKNNETKRNNTLSQKEFWHVFSMPRDIWLADRAQKEIDTINHKKVKDVKKDEFQYISKLNLFNKYSIEDLISFAQLFKGEQLPQDLSMAINQKFNNDSKSFPDQGIQSLTLSEDIIKKLKNNNKLSFITTQQIDQFLNNSTITISDKEKLLKPLLEDSKVSQSIKEKIEQIFNEKKDESQKGKSVLDQLNQEKKDFEKTALTSDIILKLSKQKIQWITDVQVNKFLENNKNIDNPKVLLILREAFDSKEVPKKLQEALDVSYIQDQKPYSNNLSYISPKAQDKIRKEKVAADLQVKKEQRKEKLAFEKSKNTKPQSKKDNKDSDFDAKSKQDTEKEARKQAREEQETIKKRQMFKKISEKDINFLNELLLILKSDELSNNIKSKVESIKNIKSITDITDKEDWKKFYKAAFLLLHPDKITVLPEELKATILSIYNKETNNSIAMINNDIMSLLSQKLSFINGVINED